ncbi:MAG: M18 family aminopeptidase, partial [Bacillota bacterium]|nr:M18 family aminopeptidase [Bacillota bacterium]
MMDAKQLAQDLLDFIHESPTAFHAVLKTETELKEKGFKELRKEDKWEIVKGGKYYVKENDSAIFAITIGHGEIERDGFRIIGAHTDSPGFRIKPQPELKTEGAYITLNTEVYGGPIMNTWFDRPLSAAGRVVLKSEGFLPKKAFVNIKKPILIIPNLAIHLNRNVNEGMNINPQRHTLPLLTLINDNSDSKNYITGLLASELGVKEEEVLDYDLFLYEFEKGTIMGLKEEFISSSRLDNLAMVHAGLKALTEAQGSAAVNILACFDNEEVGSSSRQGADSETLPHILERILIALGKSREDLFRAYEQSFMISADLSHAVHPSTSEKYDPVNRTVINRGPVIKISA